MPIPTSFESFPVRKKAKGIVYYQDRLQQVETDPSLTACSPLKKQLTPMAERGTALKNNRSSMAEKRLPAVKRGRKKSAPEEEVVVEVEALAKAKAPDDEDDNGFELKSCNSSSTNKRIRRGK
jgi:hypothetical protein